MKMQTNIVEGENHNSGCKRKKCRQKAGAFFDPKRGIYDGRKESEKIVPLIRERISLRTGKRTGIINNDIYLSKSGIEE